MIGEYVTIFSTLCFSYQPNSCKLESPLLFSQSMDVYLPVGTDCHNGNTETDGEHEVQQQKGKHLSASQLILRRGLTAFAAVALLAVGLSVHFLVALPKDISSKRNRTMDWFNTTDQIFPTAMDHNKRPK